MTRNGQIRSNNAKKKKDEYKVVVVVVFALFSTRRTHQCLASADSAQHNTFTEALHQITCTIYKAVRVRTLHCQGGGQSCHTTRSYMHSGSYGFRPETFGAPRPRPLPAIARPPHNSSMSSTGPLAPFDDGSFVFTTVISCRAFFCCGGCASSSTASVALAPEVRLVVGGKEDPAADTRASFPSRKALGHSALTGQIEHFGLTAGHTVWPSPTRATLTFPHSANGIHDSR